MVEGTLQRQGEAIRIFVRLIDGKSGFESWSERYDGTLVDVFKLQDTVARAVTDALSARLGLELAQPIVRPLTESKAAYDLYLQGRALGAKVFGDGIPHKAIGFFERVLAIDPDFAEAWVALGAAHFDGAFFNRSIAAAVKADWRRIGLDVDLSSAETQIHYQNLVAKDFEIAFDGWTADFADPITFLELLRSSAGPQNHSGYVSQRYDALIARAEHEPDAKRRLMLLSRAERIIMKDLPVAPIYANASGQIVDPALTGFHSNPLDVHPKEFVCRR